jgi:hypothetical protein
MAAIWSHPFQSPPFMLKGRRLKGSRKSVHINVNWGYLHVEILSLPNRLVFSNSDMSEHTLNNDSDSDGYHEKYVNRFSYR